MENQIYRYTIPLILLFGLVFSCKKEKEPAPITPTGTKSNYGQLKQGNYWVYQIYDVDSLGNATATSAIDSCYIDGDTLINGNTYFIMHRPNPIISNPVTYIRDSSNCIVNSSGNIIFSSTDFSSILNTSYSIAPVSDTICKITCRMADQNYSMSTPAGTFTTVNYKITTYIYPSWVLLYEEMDRHTRYAKDIGIVSETLPIFLGTVVFKERRLLRYHLN